MTDLYDGPISVKEDHNLGISEISHNVDKSLRKHNVRGKMVNTSGIRSIGPILNEKEIDTSNLKDAVSAEGIL